MRRGGKVIIALFFIVISFVAIQKTRAEILTVADDSEQLNRAIDYFQGGKYHEALLIFAKLDKVYELNKRYKAYMGVCFYYENDFENCYKYMDGIMKDAGNFAPRERAVYYFASAESYFYLGKYDKALSLYNKFLEVCHENERAEAYCKSGYCYVSASNWQKAYDCFSSALKSYKQYKQQKNTIQRIAQIQNMMNGCRERIEKTTTKTMSNDTILHIREPK